MNKGAENSRQNGFISGTFDTGEFTGEYSQGRDDGQSKKYWLYEEPEVIETGKNAIRYYKKFGKIQIALPDYVNVCTNSQGEKIERKMPGKSAALDLVSLAEDQDTLLWLIDILQGYVIE